MFTGLLPIGSVVVVGDSSKKVMIIGVLPEKFRREIVGL